MIASAFGETVNLLWGPGLVFLLVILWLIRRVIRAARTESQLEEERLRERDVGIQALERTTP